MDYQTLLPKWSIKRPDILLAKLGVMASLLLLGLQFFASQPFLLVIPLASGIGSAVYLLTQTNQDWRITTPVLPREIVGFLPALVYFLLAALVIAIHHSGTRTVPIYALTGIIGAAILLQILFVNEEQVAPVEILMQIIVATILIRLTAIQSIPGYVGVDIWSHATVFIAGIAEDGSMAVLAGDKYSMAPFYHLIGGIGAIMFGSVRAGIFLTVGLFVPLSVLFIYATTSMILAERWALLATALFAFSAESIRWGMHVIPTSLGLAFFLGTVYCVTRLFYGNAERWVIAFLLIFSLAIVFTHQVSTAIVLIFLGIAAFATILVATIGIGTPIIGKARKSIALTGVFLITAIITLVSWANTPFSAGSTFLWREIVVVSSDLQNAGFLNLASGSDGGAAGAGETQSILGQLIPYFELVGFGLLLAVAIIGGLYMFRLGFSPDLTSTQLLSAAVLFVSVYGLSIFGIRSLLPGRWIAFLYALMAILGAVGVYYIYNSGSRQIILIFFIVLALSYPMSMVAAEKATLDAPAFEDHHVRFSYTETELAAVSTIPEVVPPNAVSEQVATDHPYVTLYKRVAGYDESLTLDLDPTGPINADTVVFRSYQSSGPVLINESAETTEMIDAADRSEIVCPESWNKLYANDDVWLCSSVGTGGAVS